MENFENKCPRCNNEDKEKIHLHKDRDTVQILKCEVCDFHWGIEKTTPR